MNLRPYQQEAIDSIESSWNAGIQSICYQLPTGGGKSVVLRKIIENHYSSRKTIYVIAHRKNLVSQLSGHIDSADIPHGIIMSGYPKINYRVQVCSLMTLVSRLEKLPEPEIIIIDEFHHSKSNSYLKIINKWPDAKILGVTATPRRTDGKPLSDICQKLILGPTVKHLMSEGFLSDYLYLAPPTVDMSGVHTRYGEYVQKEVKERVDKHTITGSAIDHYREYSNYQPAIAGCVNIEHTEHVAKDFCDAGYKAIAIHSKMPEKEIVNAIKGLGDGSINVLCNADLIGEGTDIPNATTYIGLRPTQSEVIFLQHIGRVLRPHPNKSKAIILDHVGNFERHGLPDDDREWSLDVCKIDKGLSKYKRCPDCLRPILKTDKTCKYCGHVWAQIEPVERNMIPEIVKGDLVVINGIKMEAKDKQTAIRAIARHAKNKTDACSISKRLGYKARFGWYVWTNILKNV